MDEELADRLNALAPDDGTESPESDITIKTLDDETIEIIAGERKEIWHLKPLSELFGVGTDRPVDPQDHAFMPLFLRIEEEITRYDHIHHLSDATVGLSLDQLGMDPDGPTTDPLARSIQSALRLLLSLNDYSRQEVRQAFRKLSKSVQRNHDGDRGYLEFIAKFFSGAKKSR